ncbi:hypothetical protein ACN4EW_29755 [Arthrospira platensis CENA650]
MVQAGHSVSLIMDGSSVPRFNPGVMIPKTGGGYRRYPDSLSSTYLFLVFL